MLKTLAKRKAFIERLRKAVISMYDVSNVQIFVFGSFLTKDFKPGISDIDLGIYCPDNEKKCDIIFFLSQLFDVIELEHDIVDITLSEYALINVPILVYGTTLFDYLPNKLFEYLTMMIQKYGFVEKGLEVSSYA